MRFTRPLGLMLISSWLVLSASCGGGSSDAPVSEPLPATESITVTKAGSGSGSVTSSPPGVDCGATCTATFSTGATVTLQASAAPGSVFAGWAGACAGSATAVTLTVSTAQSCTATFNAAASTFTLSVSTNGTGSGSITSTSAGLNCPGSCSADLAANTSVVITAAAASGSTFAGWSGDCAGQSPNLTLAMTAARSCVATFNLGTGGGAGTSDECDDPNGSVTGHRIVKRYQFAGSTVEQADEVIGPATFDGEAVIQSKQTSTYVAGTGVGTTSETTTYTRRDGPDYKTFGMHVVSVSSATTTQDVVFSPYMIFPGAMTPGQTRTQSYTRTTTTNGGTPQNTSITEIHRFNGFETVTVAAGTFVNACSWTVTQNGFVTNFWAARGNGIAIKIQGAGELLSATIDGVPVVP